VRGEETIVTRNRAAGIVLGLALALGLGAAQARADGDWLIRNFDVRLDIHPDAGLDVTETIDADFQAAKHGILREIPVRYAVAMHQYELRVRLLGVDDGEGHPYQTSVSFEENLMKIRIGSPDFTVQGPRRYRLRYHVERAILWEGNHAWDKGNAAVLRWNATGTEWQVPILASRTTVQLPRELNDFELVADAWTGRYNERGKNFQKRAIDARTLEFTTGTLQPLEGITVEIAMPSDAVARPGWGKEIGWWLVDNFPAGVFPLTLMACLFGWYWKGRDVPGTGTIVVNYESPDALSPAEVGTLVDEKVDLRDISATFIDLAVRGFLRIDEIKPDSWFSSGSDYRFTKLKPAQGLKSFEQRLYNQLFKDGDSVTLGDLKEKFYPVLPLVRKDLYRGLSHDHYFDGNPETVRGASLGVGIMLMLAVLGAACLLQFALIGRVFFVPVIIAGILSIVTVAIASRVMPRKTRKGRIAWEKIAGLQEYIRRAEVEDIQEQERQGVFERLLPYAIIFGLSKRWGKAFENLYRVPPDWYRPAGDGNFTTWVLIDDIDRSIWRMNATFPTQPRVDLDSGGRGGGFNWSSGGFSGGGFSGGGFGGGGGSSW
jgi:uncharacterized membrane protein YgcG